MDKFKQIEAFVSAVDKGSLARAALEEQITPVMLGRRIDALEKRLGVKLLHRSTRHLALTEDGTVFLEHCRKLLGGFQVPKLVKILNDMPMTATGKLRKVELRQQYTDHFAQG